MRVHVWKRPRMASTSTSAGSRCAAASGWRAFQRSRPASASSFFCARADLDQRVLRHPSPRRLRRAAARPPASCSAAATARRPAPRVSCRAESSSSASSEHGCSSIPACRSPIAANRAGIVASVKSAGSHVVDLVPRQRRRHARVGLRPHRVRAGDRAVLRVLVVVEEDAVALLLPPLARRQRRRAPLDLARERERRAAHLVERPAPLDAHVDVDAARAGRLRPADEPEVVQRRAHDAGDLADLRPRRRRAPDRDRRAARRDDRDRRRAPDAGAARGRRGSPSRRARPRRAARLPRRVRPDGNCSATTSIQAAASRARASGRRTRRRCRWDSGRARWAGRRRARSAPSATAR